MSNKHFNTGNPSKGAPTSVGKGKGGAGRADSTANWPGLPGKAQSKPRDKSGTTKMKQSAKSEGI